MAFNFEDLMDKARELAQTGVAKAKEITDTAVDKGKELSEIGKLKVQNASEQEAIKKAYVEIGKLYFAERGAAPEAPYAALCQQISDAKAKIEYNNERIADIRAAGNLSAEEVDNIDADIDYTCECADVPAEEAPAEEAPAQDCGCGCDCGEACDRDDSQEQ